MSKILKPQAKVFEEILVSNLPQTNGVLGARAHLDERPVYSARYDTERFIVPLLAKHITIELDRHCPKGDGMQVLDVGCGRQPFRRLLEERGYKYVGMDTQPSSDGSIEIVGAIDDSRGVDVIGKGQFDMILCTEVLEHVVDWRTAFSNLASAMKHGGKLLITCPHFYIPHEEPYDFWRPTANALQYHATIEQLQTISLTRAGSGFDILGTLLAASYLNPKSHGLGDRIVCMLLRKCHKLLLGRLLRGTIQKRVSLESSLYLSNVAVFAKTRSDSGATTG